MKLSRLAMSLAIFLVACPPLFAAEQPTADQVLEVLKAGNVRYMLGKSKHPRIDPFRREKTATEGQKPLASILGCADSRVPPEIIFDQGFGDLFVVRVAGNVCAVAELASLEFGVKYLNTPLIVVLGHTECGAVKAALSEGALKGSLPKLMELIRPGLDLESNATMPIDDAIKANVWHSIAEIFRGSPGLAEMVKTGKVKVVGAVRDLNTGTVTWLGTHPKQDELTK